MEGDSEGRPSDIGRKPPWLRIKLPSADDYGFLKDSLKRHGLHTICESGNCPNIGECWAMHTATFMILGDTCTRSCRFCAVNKGRGLPPDPEEPLRTALAVKELGIKNCVLTSVTRDDLADGGASAWASTIQAVREYCPDTMIETLIPDFRGDENALRKVIQAKPDIISHNLETVRRLTPLIRVQASYNVSLSLLRYLAEQGVRTKSGIMAGLGETDEEICETMDDLIATGSRIFTLGQYLQPGRNHQPVVRYVTPEQFERFKEIALQKGFEHAECKPLVRSSYHAEKHFLNK